MSRYFNDFDGMHSPGGAIAHKAHKYIKKVKTKSGKTRYIYAKTVGSVAKNITTNPRKYGAAHMEELTPEELRRFSGKAHMEEMYVDDVPQEPGVNIKKQIIDPTRREITYYDNRYDVGRGGKKITLSRAKGEIDNDYNFTKRGAAKLRSGNSEIGSWHIQQDSDAVDKKAKNLRKRKKRKH